MKELEEELDRLVGELAVPGVAVGLIKDGEEHVWCRGVTSLRNPLPVDENTLFQIGSTTKTVTATAVMRLGLDLDAPVRAWIPELRLVDGEVAARVTLRHLLTHTGGWECDFPRSFESLSDAVAHMDELPQVAPLGFWGYQNSAYALVGRVIEVATGLSYAEAVRDLVFRPLGMEHSVFSAADAIVHRVAVGHHGTEVAFPWDLDRAMDAAGGLASSVGDQLRYARYHLGDEMAVMREQHCRAGGGYAAAMGLGWLLQSTPGLIAHGGSTNGQESAFALVPGLGFAFTVLTNSQSGAVLQRTLTKWALRNVAGITPARPELVPAGAAAAQAAAGVYRGGAWTVSVTAGDSLHPQLRVAPSAAVLSRIPDAPSYGPLDMTLYEGGGFQVAAGELRGATGEFLGGDPPTHLRLNGRLHVRVDGDT